MDIELREAIKKSIKHWNDDIIKYLKKGSVIIRDCGLIWESSGEPVKYMDDDCPLCQYMGYDLLNPCEKCPLSQSGNECNEVGSSWFIFVKKPTLQNAKKMVKALKNLLEEKDESK